jgi:hypothetical protein
MNHTKRHLTMTLVAMVCLIHQTLTAEAPPEETPTDTQSPPANNVSAGNCGIGLKVPDYLCRNVDDNQTHGISGFEEWDIDHNPSLGDDDLRPVTISGSAGEYGATMFLSILDGGEKINGKFWEDAEKKKEQTQLNWYIPPNSMLKVTVYIEGYETSDAVNDVIIEAKVICTTSSGQLSPPKIVHETTTVYEADLDVDSNNNEGLVFENGSPEEDKIEDSTGPSGHWQKRPGKIIMVNDGFGDDIPDWADGFISDPHNTATYTCGSPIQFVPMLLERKKPFTKNCKVKFTYSASDPFGVKVIEKEGDKYGFPNYEKYFTKPSGLVRIWIKNNDGTTRTQLSVVSPGSGHYVPTEVEIPWEDLSDGVVAKLWIEAVDPSATLADIAVTADISENGAVCSDTLHCTAIRITCEPITAEPQDGLYPYNPAGVVAGEDAVFKIDVDPEQFPDEEIEWHGGTGVMQATLIPLPQIGTTRFVKFKQRVQNMAWGETRIHANITGNYYTQPSFSLNVFAAWKDVKIDFFVAHSTPGASGVPAFDVTQLPNVFIKVNQIFKQAGMRFDYSVKTWDSGNGSDFWNIPDENAADSACDNSELDGDLRVIAANTVIDGANGIAYIPSGINPDQKSRAILIASTTNENFFARTLAHEIGHACGLHDIYEYYTKGSKLGKIDLNQKALRSWSLRDWPEDGTLNSNASYYSRFDSLGKNSYDSGNRTGSNKTDFYSTRHSNLIPRLLMYGYGDPSIKKCDISLGAVYGILSDLSNGQVRVGIDYMDREPTHLK